MTRRFTSPIGLSAGNMSGFRFYLFVCVFALFPASERVFLRSGLVYHAQADRTAQQQYQLFVRTGSHSNKERL